MCQISCPNPATHLVHAADHSGISLDCCAAHLDTATDAVRGMATPGVEIKASAYAR